MDITKKELQALKKALQEFQKDVLHRNTDKCICNCGNEHESVDTDEINEIQNTINLIDQYL